MTTGTAPGLNEGLNGVVGRARGARRNGSDHIDRGDADVGHGEVIGTELAT